MSELASIEILDVSYNELSNIEGLGVIGKLNTLQSLDLSHNKLKSLPGDIANLQSLEELYLDDNPIQQLPTLFQNLTLKYFSAKNVPFTSFQGFTILTLKSILFEIYKKPGYYKIDYENYEKIKKSYLFLKDYNISSWEKELYEIIKK